MDCYVVMHSFIYIDDCGSAGIKSISPISVYSSQQEAQDYCDKMIERLRYAIKNKSSHPALSIFAKYETADWFVNIVPYNPEE